MEPWSTTSAGPQTMPALARWAVAVANIIAATEKTRQRRRRVVDRGIGPAWEWDAMMAMLHLPEKEPPIYPPRMIPLCSLENKRRRG